MGHWSQNFHFFYFKDHYWSRNSPWARIVTITSALKNFILVETVVLSKKGTEITVFIWIYLILTCPKYSRFKNTEIKLEYFPEFVRNQSRTYLISTCRNTAFANEVLSRFYTTKVPSVPPSHSSPIHPTRYDDQVIVCLTLVFSTDNNINM